MPLSESDVKGYIANHPFNAFSLLCWHNKNLNLVREDDAEAYLKKHQFVTRVKISSALITSGLFGFTSAKILPGKGILKGLGVGYFTIAGIFVGIRIAGAATSGSQSAMTEIIRKYSGFSHNPQVVQFFQEH